MATTLEIIDEGKQLSKLIYELIEKAPIDEDGVLDLYYEDLSEIQDLMAKNKEDAINKLEGILFCISRMKAEDETYADAIKAYRAKRNNVKGQITYLESLARFIIECYGEDGRLPTPTFPRLKLRSYGKGKVVPNDDYNGELSDAWLKEYRPSIRDLNLEYARKYYEDTGNIPIDEDGNPMFTVTEPVVKVTT